MFDMLSMHNDIDKIGLACYEHADACYKHGNQSLMFIKVSLNDGCLSWIDLYWYRSIPILLYIGSGMSMNWSAYSARAIVHSFYGL